MIKEILFASELKHFPELPSLPCETLSISGRALKYLHQHCQKQPCLFPRSYAAFSKSPKREQAVLQAAQKTSPNAGDREYPGRLV